MSSFTPSRRSVLRTAAWTAPVVAVATAAPAFATSGASFTEVTTPALPFDIVGGPVPLGPWSVVLTTRVPVSLPVGTVVPPPSITATITVPDSDRGLMALVGATEVSGTANAPYTVQGQAAPLSADLTIPVTPVPTSGDFVITTTGTGTGFTADTAGTFTMSMEDITADLSVPPLGALVLTLTKQAAQDYTFATFTVA